MGGFGILPEYMTKEGNGAEKSVTLDMRGLRWRKFFDIYCINCLLWDKILCSGPRKSGLKWRRIMDPEADEEEAKCVEHQQE